MGSKPAEQSKKTTKWSVQVSYMYNNSRNGCTLKGLDAPTENEIIKALYAKHGNRASDKFEILEVRNKFSYSE